MEEQTDPAACEKPRCPDPCNGVAFTYHTSVDDKSANLRCNPWGSERLFRDIGPRRPCQRLPITGDDGACVERNLYASHWIAPNLIAAPDTASSRGFRVTYSFPEGAAVLSVL